METVNSLSGGKTSSYIAMHYPADYEIFALCCIDSHNAGRDIDKRLMQMANDKLQKYCSHMPEFVATSEDPIILKTMFDLEQMLGREIIWVRGKGWEQMIKEIKVIPNMFKRVCTGILKMEPIFEFLFMHTELPVDMRIGYRYDELERAENANNIFKYNSSVQWQHKSARYINRWTEIEWRIASFPLIENKVDHYQIQTYWADKNIVFPEDSNCQNCFWKPYQQLRKNFDTNAPIMWWAKIMEDMNNHTFKEKGLDFVANMPLQLDFNFGTGSGCQAGFCTD